MKIGEKVGGTSIDDNNISLSATYSSSKIEALMTEGKIEFFTNKNLFPAQGELEKLYIAKAEKEIYYFDGTDYILLSITDSKVKDIIGAILKDTSTVDFTYSSQEISADIKADSIDDSLIKSTADINTSKLKQTLIEVNTNAIANGDSQKAINDKLNTQKFNVSNVVSSFQATPDNSHLASEKLTKDNLDLKEDMVNKATDFSILDNAKYPTTQAIKTELDKKINIPSSFNANNFASYDIISKTLSDSGVNATTIQDYLNKEITIPAYQDFTNVTSTSLTITKNQNATTEVIITDNSSIITNSITVVSSVDNSFLKTGTFFSTQLSGTNINQAITLSAIPKVADQNNIRVWFYIKVKTKDAPTGGSEIPKNVRINMQSLDTVGFATDDELLALNKKYTKEFHIDPTNGDDTLGTGSELTPYKTFAKAHSIADNSGCLIILHSDTLTENITITKLNLDLLGIGERGTCYINGTITINASASSNAIRNIMTNNSIIHSGPGGLYLKSIISNGLTKSGAGYLQVKDSDLQGNNTGILLITGAGYVNIFGSKIPSLTVNNNSAIVNLSNNDICYAINVLAGTLGVNNTPIYALTQTGYALNTGTLAAIKIYLTNTNFLTPTNTKARIGITSNCSYSFRGVVYDEANSAISGTNLNDTSHFDSIKTINKSTFNGVYNKGVNEFDYLTIADLPTGGVIGVNTFTIDKYSVIKLNQTTLNQSLFLPTPSTTSLVKQIVIIGGSVDCLLQAISIKANKTTIIIWDGSAYREFNASSASVITYQTSSTTKPASPKAGDQLLITSDGLSTGSILEEWIFDGSIWFLLSGSSPVSGSVIDNTIVDSSLITTVGVYIVPATGLLNLFIGNANKYGTYDGASWTFTTPASGDKQAISSGINAGQVWSYDGASWTFTTQTTGLPTYNWVVSKSYKAFDIVINNNALFQANSNIPANTSFLIGTTGATWKQIGSNIENNSLVIGMIVAYASSVIPDGWLLCNGQSINSTNYPDLFNIVGSTVPDLRGEFIRGLDNGRGVDPGRALRSWQDDAFASHRHIHGLADFTNYHEYGTVSGKINYPPYLSGQASSDHAYTSSIGGTETRPRNVAMNYVIYAKKIVKMTTAGQMNTMIVNAGSYVELDGLRAMVPTSGSRSIQFAWNTGISTAPSIYGSCKNIDASISTANRSSGSALALSASFQNWYSGNFTIDGTSQELIIRTTDNTKAWRIAVVFGPGFNNNVITIERLI